MLGKTQQLFLGETLPKTLAVIGGIVTLLAILLFLPWNFKMSCPGTLEPVVRYRIYSPIDAEILELPQNIDNGIRVRGPSVELDEEGNEIAWRGDTLLRLRSPEMDSQAAQLIGEVGETAERLASFTLQLDDPRRQMSEYERAEKVGQKNAAEVQLKTAQEKLAIFEEYQKPHLTISSPIDGVIVSSDVRRRLTEKLPISRTQYVMEVADLEGDWQLELLMPEKRMGYIMEHKRRLDEQGKPLRVEFALATKPAEKHYGNVKIINDRAEVRPESIGAGGKSNTNMNTVSIKVALDDQEALRKDLMFGAECSAQINCGKRSLGYVIFYEVIVYVQKNILFRWF
jgi:hypothetical protein